MVVRHSEAPISHATGGIFFSDFGERPDGLLVSERMEDGHGAIEPRLYRGVTGNGEVHLAKVSGEPGLLLPWRGPSIVDGEVRNRDSESPRDVSASTRALIMLLYPEWASSDA
jgi:hypothetical protein